MTMLNRHLIIISGLFLAIIFLVLIIIKKFLLTALEHTFYYCRAIIMSTTTNVQDLLAIIIIGSFIIVFAYTFIKLAVIYLRIKSIRQRFYLQKECNPLFESIVNKLQLNSNAYLIKDDNLFAFCYGITHPKIYISTGIFNIMNVQELEAILLHESYHLKHKDSLVILMAEIFKSFFPVLLVIQDVINNFKIEREIRADNLVISIQGTSKSLVSVLKKMLLYNPIEHYRFSASIAEQETLEIRIKALINKSIYKPRFGSKNIIISFLSGFILIGILIMPLHKDQINNNTIDNPTYCLQN